MSHDAMPPTRIRATGPGCGEVELTPPDVELPVCQAGSRPSPGTQAACR